MKDIRILHGELSPGNAMTSFSAEHPEAGGIVSFVGKVRPDKDVEELELRHYAHVRVVRPRPGQRQSPNAAWPRDERTRRRSRHTMAVMLLALLALPGTVAGDDAECA